MIHAVRCPSCLNLSRVGADDLGRTVACPHCGRPFAASADPGIAPAVVPPPAAPRETPTVRPRRGWNPPAAAEPPRLPEVAPSEDLSADDLAPDDAVPSGTVFGLALLAWGIPMLWLLLPAITGRDPIFSFAAPVALAVSVCGLCVGVGFTAKWSEGTKIKVVVGLTLLGYAAGGSLYAVKKDWVEAVRRHFGRGHLVWRPFKPPGEAYEIKFPGPVRAAESPLANWKLVAFQFADDNHKSHDIFLAAHGSPPPNAPADDRAWFDAAKQAVIDASGGELVAEREIVRAGGHPGREYELGLPDGATNRIVRVFRAGGKAFYLAAEGPFLARNSPDVQDFFLSFTVTGK